jgi:hypothetical protein
MQMIRSSVTLATAFLVSALSGCSAPGHTNGASPDELVNDVIVQLDGNRAPKISTRPILLSERDAQLAARVERSARGDTGSVQQAIAVDGGCGGPSLWLYTDYDFGGIRLCLSGAGTAQLRDFSTVIDHIPHSDSGTWLAGVHSYYSGTETGGFSGPSESPGTLFCGSGFGVYQPVRDPDHCTRSATQVYLSN